MQVKTLLNLVEKHKGYIYESVSYGEYAGKRSLEVRVRPRKGSLAKCSRCGNECAGYDTLPVRRFSFVPLWGIAVFLLYAMRRVNCPECGIVVETIPWGDGKRRLTNSYAWFLADWAKRMSWKEVALSFGTSWHTVFSSVEMAVNWGRSRLQIDRIYAIGVDEIQWQLGHRYLTLVYQIDLHASLF